MGEQLSLLYPGSPFTGREVIHKCKCPTAICLVRRGGPEPLPGTSEKPPAMPEDNYLNT
jgi:hypothetical protein